MTLTYSIDEVSPYINWLYFDHAWSMSGKADGERQQLRQEARERLSQLSEHYRCHALFLLTDCHSDGDDIILADALRLPCLRQQEQGSEWLCLADFVSPHADRIGLFATTVDYGMETDFDADPYEKMMVQLIADRLAEATAERLHQQVRRQLWGYAPDEQLPVADLLACRYQGIRPAVGYPSLPDASLNFLLDRELGFSRIGIRLTETGAMRPHASVSGLMLAHPSARYFSVGKIGDDQLHDYARRRDIPIDLLRKFLAGNI